MNYHLTNQTYFAVLQAAGELWGAPLEAPLLDLPVMSAIIDGEAL